MAATTCSHASTSLLLGLPQELLEQILLSPSLSVRDICHVSQTCRLFHSVVSRIWRKVSLTRWSYWGSIKDKVCSTPEWLAICRERYQTECRVTRLLEQVIHKCVIFHLIDEDDMEGFGQLVESGCSLEMVNIVLKDILQKGPESANLSHQFYALSAYEYLLHERLVEQWKKVLQLPQEDQILEKGASLMASWLQPFDNVSPEDISHQLDTIAHQVAKKLLKDHSSLNTSCESCDSQAGEQNAGAQVLRAVRKLRLHRDIILEAMNTVIYKDIGFAASTLKDYYNIENSLIDKVLSRKIGIPLSMSTVYQAVAYRLGVLLQPVTFPQHFLLKAPRVLEREEGELFIDAYDNGRHLSHEECLALLHVLYTPSPSDFNAAPPFRGYLRMVANTHIRRSYIPNEADVQRSWDYKKEQWGSILLPAALTLQLHLCSLVPRDEFSSLVLRQTAAHSLDLNSNAALVLKSISSKQPLQPTLQALDLLTNITQNATRQSENKRKMVMEPRKVKHRNPDIVFFKVGMIMQHRRYHYRCVIHGWDEQCEMSDAWKQQMGVYNLRLGAEQPFYNVLVDDGSNRYASQENLFPCSSGGLGPVMHWEVGKYFTTFTGSEYIPNKPLSEMYPN